MESGAGTRCPRSRTAPLNAHGAGRLHRALLVPLQVGAAPSSGCPSPSRSSKSSARLPLKLRLYPKPFTTSGALCAHLICVLYFPSRTNQVKLFPPCLFVCSSEEVLNRCRQMRCSRCVIFMQDELNAGFVCLFFATLLFIYIYIKCIMKLNHTAQRLQFNGTHSPPVRGNNPFIHPLKNLDNNINNN